MDNNELKDLLVKSAEALEGEITKTAELVTKLAESEAEKVVLQAKVAKYERKESCEKIANIMIDKGIISYSDFQHEVEKMANGNDDLVVLEKVASMLTKEARVQFVDGNDSSPNMTPEQKFERGLSGQE